MARNGPFRGRSISVVNDLSLDEQRYLYRKARELKKQQSPVEMYRNSASMISTIKCT